MSHDENNESRRRFLKVAAGTTAAALVMGGLPRFARAADLLGISRTTAKRYWTYARAWLLAELDDSPRVKKS